MSRSFSRGTGASLSERVAFLFRMRVWKSVTKFLKCHSGSAAMPSNFSGSFRRVQPKAGPKAWLRPAQNFISHGATWERLALSIFSKCGLPVSELSGCGKRSKYACENANWGSTLDFVTQNLIGDPRNLHFQWVARVTLVLSLNYFSRALCRCPKLPLG